MARRTGRKTRDIKETLNGELRNPGFAREYVNGCLEDAYEANNPGILLVALADVARANRTLSAVARRLRVSRPALHRALAEDGNPSFATVFALMNEFGMRLTVAPPAPAEPLDSGGGFSGPGAR